MADHPFIPEPYAGKSTRFKCPSCEKPKEFTRYIDTQTNEYLAPHVGICNRRGKCGYHYPPRSYFADNPTLTSNKTYNNESLNRHATANISATVRAPRLHSSYIDQNLLQLSLKPKTNNFLKFIKSVFSEDAVRYVKDLYQIGTSNKWSGAVIFWQIDQHSKIRTGKIMRYNPITGKKLTVNWVHSVLRLEDFNLRQCLFGLHLMDTDKSKPIAIVESEKTAIMASIAFPDYIWMATGGINNLKTATVEPLSNRRVILFPDAGCYDLWKGKISTLPTDIIFEVSDLLETHITEQEKKEGYDIADYVLKIIDLGNHIKLETRTSILLLNLRVIIRFNF